MTELGQRAIENRSCGLIQNRCAWIGSESPLLTIKKQGVLRVQNAGGGLLQLGGNRGIKISQAQRNRLYRA